MALRLHNTRILEDDTCCFNFIFERFSDVKEAVYSKSFSFAGFRWVLQGGVKDGHFGVFLRWLGGGEHNEKVRCKAKFAVEIINNRDPTKSVRAGNMNEADEFPRVKFGIGWSKLLSVEEIGRPDSGFLDDNNLFVEVRCRMVHTVFEEKMVINLSSRTSFVSSSKFSLYGSEWYIVLYPRGEPETNTGQQYDHAAAYLHREEPSILRFKATYSLFIHGGREVQVSHHFCDNNASTAFGIEKFISTKELKALSKGGLVSIGVKIIKIEPYYYFGFDTQGWSPPDNLGDGCTISDMSLALKPSSSDKQQLEMKLIFDPGPEFHSVHLDDSAYYMKILWSIRVFCFKDANRSATVNSWDIPGKSSFCYSQDEMSLSTSLLLNEVLNPYSPFLDDEKNLCVRLIIHNANEVYDPLMINPSKHNVAKLREANAQTKSAVENFWKDQMEDVSTEKDKLIAEKEEEIAEKEEEITKKDAVILALKNEINDNNEYLAEIESTVDEVDGKKISSIQDLIQEAQPCEEELKKQDEVAEKLKAFLMENLPFSISRISVVGAAGQSTTIKGYKEVDLAVFIQDLPRTEHKTWLRAIVFTIRTLLKQESSRISETTSEDQPSLLPPCSDFNSTSAAVLFKCDDVNVVLMPINDWEPMGGYTALYKQCMGQPGDAQFFYNISACERQTEFIAMQNDKCQELIRIVKVWSNTVPWRNSSSKPSHYLLSLLVTAAFQVVHEGGENKAVRANKDVFLELADMVGDDELEVFWNEFYLSEDYPKDHFPVPFELPIVQDPAIPTHNVAATGLEDWAQFKRELSKWVAKLTL